MTLRLFGAIAMAWGLGACAGSGIGPNIRAGDSAYALMPAPTSSREFKDYVIGPLDTLEISVFQEADISSRGTVVDASGNISMPLIGQVEAAGKTATGLARTLEARLSERFYVDPQVTVTVSSSVSQRVTVQGEVENPGIYPVMGNTTLLDAVALAAGETENAELRQIVVVRYLDGQRLGAVFDLKRIRRGDDPDPAIQARDVIIVGHSGGKQAWHDVLRAAPLFSVFTQF